MPGASGPCVASQAPLVLRLLDASVLTASHAQKPGYTHLCVIRWVWNTEVEEAASARGSEPQDSAGDHSTEGKQIPNPEPSLRRCSHVGNPGAVPRRDTRRGGACQPPRACVYCGSTGFAGFGELLWIFFKTSSTEVQFTRSLKYCFLVNGVVQTSQKFSFRASPSLLKVPEYPFPVFLFVLPAHRNLWSAFCLWRFTFPANVNL